MVTVTCLLVIAIGATAPIEAIKLSAQLTGKSSLAAISRIQGRSSISGHVFDTSRRPIENLYVELLDQFDSVIRTVRTNGSGLYSFTGLGWGTFQVRVLTHGTDYIGETRRVEIIRIGQSNSSIQEDFVLRSKTVGGASATGTAGTVFVQAVPNDAKAAYKQAVEDLGDEKKEEAGLAGLKKAIDIFPNYYDALERLGNEYIKRKQYESARVVLLKAVEVNPRGYLSWYALGFAQYNLKQTAAAIESLQRSITVNPNSINSHFLLGIALRSTGQFDQALTHLKRVKELSKNTLAEAHWQLALIYNQLKRYKEAADELELFLKAQPDSRDAENIKKLIKQLREKAK